ncbi:T6SS immunity protein Tdi1 domain-containing protein [Rossellomorea sp. FS2]|uniref:T6SS immunity protein Tdi1 domain-containing protein n=1 Tax=Rossellomorea sp. FS2 TaxID=3391447 RepID=UPI003A4DEDA7
MDDIFKDFKFQAEVSTELYQKYSNRLPKQVLAVWEKYGFGSALNGYLKIVNPDDYQSLINETYLRSSNTTVVFMTSLGDAILWEHSREENQYLVLVNFRKGKTSILEAGFNFFFEDLEDDGFKEKDLDWKPYSEAVEKYGEPAFDECFGYTPLLGLGGAEKVENLKKVKLKEHILIMTEFMGPVQ